MRSLAGVAALACAACTGPSELPTSNAPAPVAPPSTPEKLVAPPTATPIIPASTTPAPDLAAPPPDDLTPKFSNACSPGDTITIAAVGDLLLHHELQIQAYAAPENFLVLWSGVRDLLAQADLTYANLEGTTAAGLRGKGVPAKDPGRVFDGRVYTTYPRFNYHPSLLDDLVTTGIDIVSTANNHALDRGPAGIDATLDALDRSGLAHSGTLRATEVGKTSARWHAISQVRGLTIAWLACTETTNQIPDPNAQVLRCSGPQGQAVAAVRALAKDPAIDAVIVTPHWGQEKMTSPNRAQTKLAQQFADAGATAILGSHPHVLQGWETLPSRDGREVLVVYSLGNFVSHQPALPQRSTMIVYVGLTKPPGARAHVHGVRYVPLHVRQDNDQFFVEAIDRVGGPADSRALTVEMFGTSAVLDPETPLVTRPACPQTQPIAED